MDLVVRFLPDLPAALSAEVNALSAFELIAVVLAVGYLLLAIRQNIWCWLCAGISTIIYVFLFMRARLYMESVLNAFYCGMAVYGWRVWRRGSGGVRELAITVWPVRTHLAAVAIVTALSLATGFLLERHTDAAYPYVDAATTYAAFWATFLVARKVLENWWYWLLIDLVSIVIYWERGLPFTSLLFVAYVLMIPFGLLAWTRSYRGEADSQAAACAP